MACPILDKLPAELRTKIYKYVLDFDDTPLRHLTQLKPFVKKLTGIDGELPFAYEDGQDSISTWIMSDESGFGNTPVNTAILCVSKLIYNEAIKVFYDLNTISVDIELFKLANVTSPASSDLSLAKRLLITFNGSCNIEDTWSRKFNSIDLDNLFARVQVMFPRLNSIVVHTDKTTLPIASLFAIGQDCHDSAAVEYIAFDGVGSFVATTRLGIILEVRFKQLVDLWQEAGAMSREATKVAAAAVRTSRSWHEYLEGKVMIAYSLRSSLQDTTDTSSLDVLRSFFHNVMSRTNPIFANCGYETHEFWTHFATPEPYHQMYE